MGGGGELHPISVGGTQEAEKISPHDNEVIEHLENTMIEIQQNTRCGTQYFPWVYLLGRFIFEQISK